MNTQGSNQSPSSSSTSSASSPRGKRSNIDQASAGSGRESHGAASLPGVVSVSEQVKANLDQQVAKGARMIANVAQSARRAADELDTDIPQLADLVRGVAGSLEGYSRNLEDQSIADIYQAASDFTRRQPALVFGVSALAGFLALRTLRTAQAAGAQSNRPQSMTAGRGLHNGS